MSITNRESEYIKPINKELAKVDFSMVEVGRLLNKAEEEFKDDYDRYKVVLKNIDLSERSIQRIKKIASNKCIETNSDKLPQSWGTLYEITKFKDDQITESLGNGKLTRKSQRKDVIRLFNELNGIEKEIHERKRVLLQITTTKEVSEEAINFLTKIASKITYDGLEIEKLDDWVCSFQEKEIKAERKSELKEARKLINSSIKSSKKSSNATSKMKEFTKRWGKNKEEVQSMDITKVLDLLGFGDYDFKYIKGLDWHGNPVLDVM